MAEPDEYIDFMAKYREWVSFKRLGIRPDTKPEEVVHHLAGIRATIDAKAYTFLGIKTEALDQHASKITGGMRKGYASLGDAIKALDSPDTKAALDGSCDNKALVPIAQIYLLGKVVSNLGYDTSINQTVMSKIFPDLKPPKAPGMGRGKKKTEESE